MPLKETKAKDSTHAGKCTYTYVLHVQMHYYLVHTSFQAPLMCTCSHPCGPFYIPALCAQMYKYIVHLLPYGVMHVQGIPLIFCECVTSSLYPTIATYRSPLI